MPRVQLALNVDDVDQAVAFYSKLFGAEPAKRRPGYANFAVAEPALKLVLIENPGRGGTLNHLGVEVESTEAVAEASGRLSSEGLATSEEQGVTCCYALQDKVWVNDPSGAPWEIYTVLADAPGESIEGDAACCGGASTSAAACCWRKGAPDAPSVHGPARGGPAVRPLRRGSSRRRAGAPEGVRQEPAPAGARGTPPGTRPLDDPRGLLRPP